MPGRPRHPPALLRGGEHVTHTIANVSHVRLERTEGGADVALQVQSADELTTLLRFPIRGAARKTWTRWSGRTVTGEALPQAHPASPPPRSVSLLPSHVTGIGRRQRPGARRRASREVIRAAGAGAAIGAWLALIDDGCAWRNTHSPTRRWSASARV